MWSRHLIDLFQEFERVGVVLIGRFLQPVTGFERVFGDILVAAEVEGAEDFLRTGVAGFGGAGEPVNGFFGVFRRSLSFHVGGAEIVPGAGFAVCRGFFEPFERFGLVFGHAAAFEIPARAAFSNHFAASRSSFPTPLPWK